MTNRGTSWGKVDSSGLGLQRLLVINPCLSSAQFRRPPVETVAVNLCSQTSCVCE